MASSAGPDDTSAHTLPARLAARIIERARQLGLPAGSHLTEQALADAFRVSRTPVRMALRALEEQGLVESRPNRGFFLTQPADADARGVASPTPEGADEDPLYFRIAEDRLSGRLPNRSNEAELARRYDVSRARLVRPLARMAEEGWLSRLPGHGWEFQPLLTEPEAYDQGYRYRMLIEPAALLEPGYRIDAGVFAEARARQHAMLHVGIRRWPRTETFAVNSGFHEVLVAASGNFFLLEGLRRVNRLRRLLEYRTHQHRERLVQECRDHLALLDMVEEGRREEASRFLYAHLDRARQAKAGIIAAEIAPRAAPAPGEEPEQTRRYGHGRGGRR